MTDRRVMLPQRLRQVLASVRRFFDTGNLLRFLLSMVLAFGLWAWVTYQNDPETTRVLGGITVTVENLQETFEIVGELPTVDITVQGPQSIITPLERDSVVASADMSEIDQTGDHEVDVSVDVPSDVRIRDVAPETVALVIDQMNTREDIPVSVREPEDVPANYQVRSIEFDEDTVAVSGPDRTIQQIERAVLEIQVDGRTSSFTDTIEPMLLDEHDNEIHGIQIDPSEISVTVTLDVRGQVRKIIPVIVGDDALAPGHDLIRTTVLPTDEVIVDGPEEELSNVFFLTTTPIDVTGWDESQIVRDVEIDQSRIPAEITVDEDTVHVSIEIRRQVHQREISEIPIGIMNAAPNTMIELASDTASVTLEGSRTAVEAVESDDITVFINVANAEPGNYDFEVRVIVPAQVQYREIEPEFMGVTVTQSQGVRENDDEG